MNETMTAAAGLRTYRGETIESLLPQIREELGPDAVIVRQREGLIGGVGGFFQKRCVEVDARPGGPGVDVYDEEPEFVDEPAGGPRALSQDQRGGAAVEDVLDPPADSAPPAGAADMAHEEKHFVRNDAATREGLATPAVQELVDQAQPFADLLRESADGTNGPNSPADGPNKLTRDDKSSRRPQEPIGPPRAEGMRQAMTATGLGEDIARDVVDAVVASAMPFANPGRLRTLVRNELALRIPVAPLAAPGRRTIAMVGPAGSGKSTAIAAIGAAHEAAGVKVERVALEEMPARGVKPAGLLLVDTPPLWGGAEGLAEAAKRLGRLKGAEIHLVMRAGTAAPAGAELLEGLAALRPNRLLISGAGETSYLGGVLDLAIRAGVPLGYVAEGALEIAPADPRELARRVTP
jgi:flagellar biosynthesis GTPase FlhF